MGSDSDVDEDRATYPGSPAWRAQQQARSGWDRVVVVEIGIYLALVALLYAVFVTMQYALTW